MAHAQSRDIEKRSDGQNGATPVFDPALSPGSTDAEAGGAATPAPGQGHEPPTRHAPEGGSLGVRLTPRFWYATAGVIVVVLIIAALMS